MAQRLRSVDLIELRGLCLAIELGSLGRAAETMGISQPALSKRMRELELFAGTPLLDRSPRGVVPTTAGELLYREARGVLSRAEQLEELLDSLRGRRAPLRLAASHTIAEYLLPAPLAAFDLDPVELVAANSSVVRDLVLEDRADLGLAAAMIRTDPRRAGLVETELCEDEIMVAVAASHPWARGGAIALEQFIATPAVMRDPSSNARQLLDRALAAHGLRVAPPVAEVGSSGAAIAAASTGRAPAVLSVLAIQTAAPVLVARRVQGLDLRRRFVLITRAGREPGAPARALGEHLYAALHNEGLSRLSAGNW